MCREVCELVKTFLFPPIAKQLDQTTTTTGTTPSIGATTSMSSISMDENGVDNTDLEQMSTKDGEGLSGGSGGAHGGKLSRDVLVVYPCRISTCVVDQTNHLLSEVVFYYFIKFTDPNSGNQVKESLIATAQA